MTRDQKLIDIYNSYFLDVYRYSMYKLGKKEEAEDVTSEVFARLIKYEKFDEIENIKAWLITVSRNLIYDKFRKKMKSVSLLQNDDDDYIEIEDEGSRSFESEFVDEQLLTIVRTKLSELDSLSSEVITLKVWEDMTFKDIASALGINENTAKQKFYRGIEKIKSDISLEVKQTEDLSDKSVLSAVNKVKFEEQYQPDKNFRDELFDNLFTNSVVSAGTESESKRVFIMFRKPQLLLAFYSIILFTIATVFGASRLIQNSNNNGGAYETDLDEEQELSNGSRSTIEAEECGLQTFSDDNLAQFAFGYDSCIWDVKKNISLDDTNVIKSGSNIEITLISKPEERVVIDLVPLAELQTLTGFECTNTEFKIINEEKSIGRVKVNDIWLVQFGIFEYSEQYYLNDVQTPNDSTYCMVDKPNITPASEEAKQETEFINLVFSLNITEEHLPLADELLQTIDLDITDSELVTSRTKNFDSNFEFDYPIEASVFIHSNDEFQSSEDDSREDQDSALIIKLENGQELKFVETKVTNESLYNDDSSVEGQNIFEPININGDEKEFLVRMLVEDQTDQDDNCLTTKSETYFLNVNENIYAILQFSESGDCEDVDQELERLHNAKSTDKLIEIIESIN